MAKESRLEILKGKDAGVQFRITGDRVVFGRAEDSDIVVNDSVASRHHAELVRIGASFLIKDLGSSNGTYVNGNKTTEHYLMNNDVFSIGEHSYRYIESESKEPKQHGSLAMDGNTIPGISIKSLSSDINIPKAGGKTASKKRLIIYGVLGVFIIFILIILMSGGDEPKEAKNEKAKTPEQIAEDELTKKEDEGMDKIYKRKIAEEDREVYENANQFYFEGRRELRLKNYSRALDLFRKALMLYPEHVKSSYYVKITQEFMKQESELQMKLGRKMLDHKRYNEAIRHFTEVINLNARELESSVAKEAQKWRGIAEKERDKVTQE